MVRQGHDRHSTLEAENAELRSRLQTCEQSYALLQAEIIELRQQHWQFLHQVIANHAPDRASASQVLKKSLDLLSTDPDLDKFVGHVLTAIAQQFQSPLTEYWSQDEHTAYVERIYWEGRILDRTAIAQVFPCHIGLEGFIVPPAMIGGVSLNQRKNPIFYDDHSANPFTKDLQWVIQELIPRNLLKEINVPLFLGDTTIGALTIHLPHNYQFTVEQVELAQSLAHQVTLATEMQRLAESAKQAALSREQERAAQERATELAKVNESLQRSLNHLAGDHNLESFLGQVLREAIQVLGGEAAQIFLYDDQTHTLAPSLGIDEQGFTRPEPGLVSGLPIGEPFPADITVTWQHLCACGQPGFYDIDRHPEIFWPGTIEWHRSRGEKGVMATPLILGDQPLGLMGLTFINRTEFTAAEFALFQALAQQATLAIHLAHLAEENKQAVVAREREKKVAQARAAELATINQSLTQRDRLLSVVAQVTQDLLENLNVEQAIAQSLAKLGIAAGASRVNVLDEIQDAATGKRQHRTLMEWTTPNTPRQIDDPATHIVTNDDVASVIAELHAGRAICLPLEDYPEPIQSAMAGIGIKVSGIAPIVIEGEYFGCLCFDNCEDDRLWSEQEMDVLMTGAKAIGAALLRQRLVERLMRSRAEQQRAAELAKANDALKQSLNAIAVDADPRQIIAHILRIVAEQFETPLVEYWTHSVSCHTAHLNLTYCQGRFLGPAEQPGHPGTVDFPCFPCLIHCGHLEHPPYFLIDDITTDRDIQRVSQQIGIDVGGWFSQRGVSRLLNIPLWLNEKTIGALDIWLPGDRSFSRSEIELAYTFGQQITLATYLNQLFEEAKQTVLFEERNRIASDIHDTLAQAFTGISLQLEVAKPLVKEEPETVEHILQHISQLAKNGLDEARQSVWALYPPGAEYANLAQMLYDSVEQMSRNTPISLEVNIIGNPCPLSPYIGMNLLRIGQEALTNALKHSQAQTVLIELIYTPDLVSLSIRDDGRGFTPPTNLDNLNGGFGLVGMYERCDRIGAQLTILSQPGQGCQILVESPLQD